MSDSSLSLYSFLNFDPESHDASRYSDAAVQQYMMRAPLEAQERWQCVVGGMVHKNVCPLCMACSLGASLSVVMLLASADPTSLEERDNFGWTPLHYSCLFGGSIKVVRFLITKSPQNLTTPDYAGQLPLHIALWKRASPAVIQLLLEKHPDACKVSLSDGRLPLHIACSNQASIEVIQLLLDLYPKAAHVAEEGGWTPLHYACRNDGSYQVIEKLLHAHPQSATIPQANGWLPLHLLCANQAAEETISLLLLACPEAAAGRDEMGYLPLHEACKYEASEQAISRLVNIYNDACRVQGKDGSLPLHLACKRQLSLEIIDLIVSTYPRGLRVKNNDGDTPLDVSRRQDESVKRNASSSSTLGLMSSYKLDVTKLDPTPFDRKISSHLLRNALLAKCPRTAVPLPLPFLRKCTRKFSESKNMISRNEVYESFRGLDMRTCTAFGVERYRANVLLSNHEELIKEVEDLSHLNHPNLVRLLGYCLQETHGDRNYVVYELPEGGTLASLLSSKDRIELDWKSRIRVGASIVSALAYLSSQNRFHESLRPENVCFWEGYSKVLLTDYGSANLFKLQPVWDASISRPFAAPELLDKTHEFDEACQVYAVGSILKALITGQLPSDSELPGTSKHLLVSGMDPLAGDWDLDVLESFASLTESCMYDVDRRDDRPTLSSLLEKLLRLEEVSAAKVASTGKVLGTLLHVEQMNAEKEQMTHHDKEDSLVELYSHDVASLTRVASCRCSRTNVGGIVCCNEKGHFCCNKCFSELVNEQLGAPSIVCREANCTSVYSAKQIYDHVEEKVFYDHISEVERSAFLEGLWGRGAARVMHVRQNEALKALNAMASRDPGHPEFPPLCVLCLVTSRQGGSRPPNPLSRKKRLLLYFVCACSKTPVKAAIKISRTRKWLRRASPALKASMVALDICISQTTGLQMTHTSVGKYMSMPVVEDEINQFADETWESLVETFGLYGHDSTGKLAHARLEEARNVTKVAYEMLAELASSYPDWTKEMQFAANRSGIHGWVKNENVEMWKQLD